MRSLKLSEWAHVAEILAAVVIVASLAYVGLEINQNTKALQNESYQYVFSMLAESQNILVTDKDFNRVFDIGERSPSELSDEEWSRLTKFLLIRWSAWEYLFMMKEEDSISPVAWTAFDPGFRVVVCMRGHRRFFEESSLDFAPRFIAYLEADVFPNCAPQ